MKLIIALLVIAVVQGSFVADKLRRPLVKDGLKQFNTQDFITGILLAMRFVEKVPDAYVCAANVDGFHQSVATAKNLFHQGGVDNIVKAVQTVADALDAATHGCGNTVAEVDHYFGEVRRIVTGATFKHDAQRALFQNAETVGRDVADFILAIHQHDELTAGTRVGDILRIVIWGDPNPRFAY